MQQSLDVTAVRRQFPGLLRTVAGRPAAFLDGPAGSQVPVRVANAVADYLLHHNANHGGDFATSQATDAMVDAARAAFADLLAAPSPEEIVFGPNMTTLTFQLSRALARTWQPGDEVVVTDSDHDANVTPWTLAAADRGVTVRRIPVRADTTLDLAACERLLSPRTRLVAVGAASNLSGTIHDVAAVARLAHRHGALVFVDAVHFAAHRRVDVTALGCDFLSCSAYKFFGPHLGVLWGHGELLERLTAYKVRPAADHGPEKWQTGTANFEAIAGGLAAVEYLAELGGNAGDRRRRLDVAFARIAEHEQQLCARLLRGLARLPVRVVGLGESRLAERCATVSFVPTDGRSTPEQLSRELAARGVFSWAGHSYAVALASALDLLPHGVVRLGLLHYHTETDVDRALEALGQLLACAPSANP